MMNYLWSVAALTELDTMQSELHAVQRNLYK